MPRSPSVWSKAGGEWSVVVLMLLLAGCSSPKPLVYEDNEGFHFVPPPGWIERARGESIPTELSQRQQNLPLPPLGLPGHPQERFLVRYDRISTGQRAWLRVTVADVPPTTPLKACLSSYMPGRDWKRESEEENLEVSGLPAARIAFVGRWSDQDYLCETFALRKGEKVYFFASAFPAADEAEREQIRQAVFHATWQ